MFPDLYDQQDNKGVFVSHAMYDSQQQYVASFDGHVQCSLSYVNIQPADVSTSSSHDRMGQWAGCQLAVDVHNLVWTIKIVSNGTHTVRCGVVCTCPIDPENAYEEHQCIRPLVTKNGTAGIVHDGVPLPGSDDRDRRLDWFIPAVLALVLVAVLCVTSWRCSRGKVDDRKKFWTVKA